MTERDEIKKEMDERLSRANNHIKHIQTLQKKCGKSFTMEAFKNAIAAQDAWQAEMTRYRQLSKKLENLDEG